MSRAPCPPLALPVLLCLCATLAPWPARAQMGMTGTCSGSVSNSAISGTLYLNVNGTRVNPMAAGGVFGLSECQCRTTDVALEVIMQQAVPMAVQDQGVTMYIGVGTDCTDPNTRANTCRQVQATDYASPEELNLSFDQFKQPGRAFTIRLPAALLTAPQVPTRPQMGCENVSGETRTLTIILGDPSAMNPATCKMSIPIRTSLPPAPTGLSTQPGNGAVTVGWQAATIGQGVERYQVLCRDRARPNEPLKPDLQRTALFYSVCVDPATRQHERRKNIPGTGAMLPTPDMARAGGDDEEEALRREIAPGRKPLDSHDMAAADMGAASAFERLDPRFLCSGEVRAGGQTALSVRVDGLENGRSYDFIVVAIDSYGNPSPSPMVNADPQPTQNLLEAVHSAGNYAGGFSCAVSRRAAAVPAALLLGLPLLLLVRARRRARRPDR